ncbi:E3 ubiquitin-protein ligase TRIM33 [Nematostella vectensis]|uniref:E3 ubiquitin-protein ligase TRIM33 n=1 Tax=Nematostella vectensis TaxID=45351 RepID=UPI00139064B0|nr:E3 ubiquitin-protein ligase TRIM33 [Nematostella vectensis]XP_032227597.1 E3 ubiquitin-protein ligase TRIM33 [Nematostella vectensis]XP_048584693.1 E3 ubiquitin-protein ligase TRIM33 [Nematostella vectensis]
MAATGTDKNFNEDNILLRENLTKFITCPSCKETMNGPVLLPCLDSICRSCCQKTAQKHGDTWTVPCRLCDSLVRIPQTSDLKTNFFACNVNNYLRCCLDAKDAVICSNCDENSALAEARCMDCNEFLCQMCVEAHRRIKLTREHQVIIINEEKPLKILQSLHVNLKCSKHKDEKLLLRYCANCNEPLCLSCISEHANLQHKVEELTDSSLARCLFKVGNIIDEFLEMRKVLHDSMEGVEAEKRELENQAQNCKQEIEEATNKIIEAVLVRKNTLLKDLELVSDCTRQALDDRTMKHCKELSCIDRAKVFIGHAFEQGNSVEKLSVLRTVEDRVKEMKTGHMNADFLYTGMKTRYLELADNSQSDQLKVMILQWGSISKEPELNPSKANKGKMPPKKIIRTIQPAVELKRSEIDGLVQLRRQEQQQQRKSCVNSEAS